MEGKFKVDDHIVSLDGSTELIIQFVGTYKYMFTVVKDDQYRFPISKPSEEIDAIDPEYSLKQ